MTRLSTLAMLMLVIAASQGAQAQSARLDLDAGAAHARPPADVEAEPATYAMLGGRFVLGPLFGSLYGGLGADSAAADWLGAALGVTIRSRSPASARFGVTAAATVFTLGDPTPYEAATFRLMPELRFGGAALPLAVRLHGGVGQSDVIDTRVTPNAAVISDLWMYGAGMEISRPFGSVQSWLGTDAFETSRGVYFTGYAGAGGVLGPAIWRVGAQLWDAPNDLEVQLEVSLTVPFRPRWSLELTGGRRGPDPLLGSPAGVDGSFLVSWNPLLTTLGPAPIVTLTGEDRRLAVFQLESTDAGSVSLIGDFSDWRPVEMARQGKRWVVRLPMEPGLYHFGFLVDGEWYVPEGAPGKITDEFGRLNATLVVPDE